MDSPHPDGLSRAGLPSAEKGLRFERNAGQFPEPVEYFARGRGYEVALHEGGAIISLYRSEGPAPTLTREPDPAGAGAAAEKTSPRELTVRRFGMELVGMDDPATPEGRKQQASRTHYLTSSDQADWHTDIPNFARVRYAQAYDGIDVVFRGDEGRIRHDFVVAPGADPQQIRMRYRGAEGLARSDDGDLVLDLGEQELIQKAPVAFQPGTDGSRQLVEAEYAIDGNTIGFDLGEYDRQRQLVIDPTLQYSSYFGGSGNDGPAGVDVDIDGNIYVFMETASPGLATAGAFQETRSSTRNVDTQTLNCPDCTDSNDSGFVTRTTISGSNSLLISKFSPDGTTLLWSTYLDSSEGGLGGGPGVNSVAVTPSGEAAFGMIRTGPELPLLNQTQGFPADGEADYIAKLNNAGNGLVFATYLQVGDFSLLRGLDVSATGEVAAVGLADSSGNLPVTNPLPEQTCPDETAFQRDIYTVRFQSNGTLDFLTCIGGDGFGDQGRGIEYADDGLIYLLMRTDSSDFPTTMNAIQSDLSSPGVRDMAISVIDPDMSVFEYSTYLGPEQPGNATIIDGLGEPSNDAQFLAAFFPIDIGVDDMGRIYVTGITNLLHYPTTDNTLKANLNHPLTSYTGEEFTSPTQDIYVTKLDRFNGVLDYSTYLGGTESENGLHAMEVDNAGNAYILTVTNSDDYPVAAAIEDTLSGKTSIAVTRLAPSGALSWSTYLGTDNDSVLQIPGGLALHDDAVVFASSTLSDAWPVTADAFQGTLAGGRDTTINILDTSGDTDTDGDGVIDATDGFPDDANEWRDTDGDGIGNVADTDDDGDGTDDAADAFPLLAGEQTDSDGDGLADNADLFPNDALAAFDFDGDGTADFVDEDMDGDGFANEGDAFPLAADAQLDCDGDGVSIPVIGPALSDAFDPDDDNDGTPDVQDIAPFDDNRPVRTFEAFNAINTQRFKSPLPTGFEMVADADGAWTSASDDAFGGTGSLSTYNAGTTPATNAVRLVDDSIGGQLSFRYRVDSEAGSDFLRVFLNGDMVLEESGDSGWQLFTQEVTAGEQTLRFEYNKDASGSAGADAAWIDNIAMNEPDLIFRDGGELTPTGERVTCFD